MSPFYSGETEAQRRQGTCQDHIASKWESWGSSPGSLARVHALNQRQLWKTGQLRANPDFQLRGSCSWGHEPGAKHPLLC